MSTFTSPDWLVDLPDDTPAIVAASRERRGLGRPIVLGQISTPTGEHLEHRPAAEVTNGPVEVAITAGWLTPELERHRELLDAWLGVAGELLAARAEFARRVSDWTAGDEPPSDDQLTTARDALVAGPAEREAEARGALAAHVRHVAAVIGRHRRELSFVVELDADRELDDAGREAARAARSLLSVAEHVARSATDWAKRPFDQIAVFVAAKVPAAA